MGNRGQNHLNLAAEKTTPNHLPQYSLVTSLFIHGLFLAALFWTPNPQPPPNENIEIDVFTPPQEAKRLTIQPKVIPNQKSKITNPKARAVFGVTRNSLTDSPNPDAATAKAGNTLSKDPDNLELKPGEENLPAPAEDFEVSQWPTLQNTVHIPYPAQAKQKNIEGDVIMDIYIAETGEVKKAVLISGPGYGLNEAALMAVRKFLFTPAFVNGKTVPVIIRYTYKFKIQR